MNSLRESILQNCKDTNVINENITPEQAGNLIIKLFNKNYTNSEIIKALDNLVHKDWINITKLDSNKVINVSIIPKDYDTTHGDIIDVACTRKGNIAGNKIRYIIDSWKNKIINDLKEKNKGYKVILLDKDTYEKTLTA